MSALKVGSAVHHSVRGSAVARWDVGERSEQIFLLLAKRKVGETCVCTNLWRSVDQFKSATIFHIPDFSRTFQTVE